MSSPKNIIVATSRPWHEPAAAKLGAELITDKSELTIERLEALKPDVIFFPHWSHKIPAEIYYRFNCIIFHMTDLPYGRGGSPLQNLIMRGHKTTKISAIQCVEALDAGDIYLKEELDLSGSAQEIFERSAAVIADMMQRIIEENPTPTPQEGDVVTFKRRTPEQSEMRECQTPEAIYDHIRMLDAEGYPKAFINVNEYVRVEFDQASLVGGKVNARTQVIMRNET